MTGISPSPARCGTSPTTGARLRVEGSVSIPDTFELIIEVDGLEADCQVVWRKANEVGVKFLAAPRIVAAKRAQVISPVAPAEGALPAARAGSAGRADPRLRRQTSFHGGLELASVATTFVPETFSSVIRQSATNAEGQA